MSKKVICDPTPVNEAYVGSYYTHYTVSEIVFAKSGSMFYKTYESFKENVNDSLMEDYEMNWSDSCKRGVHITQAAI